MRLLALVLCTLGICIQTPYGAINSNPKSTTHLLVASLMPLVDLSLTVSASLGFATTWKASCRNQLNIVRKDVTAAGWLVNVHITHCSISNCQGCTLSCKSVLMQSCPTLQVEREQPYSGRQEAKKATGVEQSGTQPLATTGRHLLQPRNPFVSPGMTSAFSHWQAVINSSNCARGSIFRLDFTLQTGQSPRQL